MSIPYPKPGRYLDPLTDYGFKKLFGSEKNKDILIDFLNQLFSGRKIIHDFVYQPVGNNEFQSEDHRVIFDLLCTSINGEQFIVEIQCARQEHFRERVLLYTSRLVSSRHPKNTNDWNYQLPEIYHIAILEFDLTPEHSRFVHDYALCDKQTREIFYDKLEFKFIELTKFTKAEHQFENDLDRWLFLLRHLSKLDRIPANFRKSIFEKVFSIAELSNFKAEERQEYDGSVKAKWEYENSLRYLQKVAMEKGRLEGKREGQAEGFRLALTNGVERMLREGMSEDMICKFLKVTPDFVNDIKISLK